VRVLPAVLVSVATPPTVNVVGSLATVVRVVIVAGGFMQLQADEILSADLYLLKQGGFFSCRFSFLFVPAGTGQPVTTTDCVRVGSIVWVTVLGGFEHKDDRVGNIQYRLTLFRLFGP
jgi:hypothetical protein